MVSYTKFKPPASAALRAKCVRSRNVFLLSWCIPFPSQILLRLRDPETGELTRRRSPKRGAMVHILRELVYIPELLNHPNFAVEAVLTEEEELQTYDPRHGEVEDGAVGGDSCLTW